MSLSTYFILGYPRSGTTWFANLFNTHPDVIYRHEMIGRCYMQFPDELFKKLKSSHTLTENDYNNAIKVILSPDIESDRAPFFKKNHLTFSNPKFHYFAWLATRAASFLKPLYIYLFYPKGSNLNLVIKETRSAIDMDNIIAGLRADKNIILFRHPCGAIASSLRGIETGKMQPSTKGNREKWFSDNKDKEYISKQKLQLSQVLAMPEHEYLALCWRLQNEDYIALPTVNNNIYINYEDFMVDQEIKVKKLFDKLSLSYDPSVEQFIQASSGTKNEKPLMKDSSSTFYSVYRNEGFNPNKWMDSLESAQISAIERHTLDVYEKLLSLYN